MPTMLVNLLMVLMVYTTHGALPDDMTAMMDTSVDPCEDFYRYACGNWIKTHELKPSEVRTDTSFTVVTHHNEEWIQEIVKEGPPLIGEFWESCMAMENITALGSIPLEYDLQRLIDATDHAQVFELAGDFARVGNHAILSFDVGPDPKDVTTNTLYAYPAPLSLQNTDYYENDTFPHLEADYRAYINDLMALSRFSLSPPRRTAADSVITMEQAIVKLQREVEKTSIDQRLKILDATNRWPITFGSYSKGFGLLDTTSLTSDDRVLFSSFKYLELIETDLIPSILLDDLKVYIAFVMINSRVLWLGNDFDQLWFDFYGVKMNGLQEQVPRETTCVARELQYFPDLMGTYYYNKAFDKEREENIHDMVKLIEEAMGQRIQRLHWLDSITRNEAIKKLDKVVNLIGQSTAPRLYNFNLSRDKYADNVYVILLDAYRTKMHVAGKRVNWKEWSISSAEVNAYYSAMGNNIVLPAAILQPPLFHGLSIHPARNFGSIGAIIGHELTHGFDAKGRLYDGDGNKRPWWTNRTAEEFHVRASCLQAQYSNFTVIGEDGRILGHVNGTLTIEENIADNGGLSLSWDAYRKYMKTVDSKLINSTSSEEGDQMFFIAFAQNWCGKSRDQALLQQLATDLHAPGEWRANGVAMNSNEFAHVFHCQLDTPMNPSMKCQLW